MSGDEALRMGLANRLTEPGGALDAARALAHELAALPPLLPARGPARRRTSSGATPLDDAMRIELAARAGDAARRAKSLEGAIRFAEGAGRHGDRRAAQPES